MVPILTQAIVLSQDPTTGGLNVAFPSGQVAAYPVKFGYHGPADGVRINHPAMPGRGTWGLVAFPGGDDRAGVWIASVYNAMQDARTTNSDGFLEYNSHFSGYYTTLDKTGQQVTFFPDGSSLIMGADTARPPTFRHVVDDKQFPQLQSFSDGERVPNPPTPFSLNWRMASGVTLVTDPAGNCTISTGAGVAILNITPAGVVNIMAAGVVNMLAGAQINIGGLSETLRRLIDERFVALYNAHVHPTPSGLSGAPTVPISAGSTATSITFAG